MIHSKILTNFKGMSDTKLLETLKSVKKGMVNNPHFPMLVDQVSTLVVASDLFENSIPAANVRNQVNVAEKNAKREALMPLLYSMALDVMSNAKDNRMILETTGFQLQAPRAKNDIPDTPENITLFLTNTPTTLLAACPSDKTATLFYARGSVDQKNWSLLGANNTSKVLVKDAPLGVLIYVQMAAKNGAGVSSWSNVATIRLPLPDEPTARKANI